MVFYAQSTGTVISGRADRERESGIEKEDSETDKNRHRLCKQKQREEVKAK